MSFSRTRAVAILRKELRDYRRNRFTIVFTMAVLPLIFITVPMISIFTISGAASSSRLDHRIGLSLLYLLILPAIVPATLAAYSVVGEREQGTLEPVLITPISREEFLVGKALAALIPALTVAYTIFGIFLAATTVFAAPAIATAVYSGSHIPVQLLFTPLLAGWSIWVGIAISARSADIRVAQQLGVFASLPPLAIVALIQLNDIPSSTGLALGLAAALLLVDGLGWRVVAPMFDRERLVTGRRADASYAPSANHTPRKERSTPMSATLTLRREGTGIELRRGTFEIEVDGKTVGSIQWHETVDTPLEPGLHILRIRKGRYSSTDHAFEVADGGTVNFRCHGAMVWPRYVASILKPDIGISLRAE